MEIQRARNLGLLHQQLGIEPDTRVTVRLVDLGIEVWDLSTGILHFVKVIPDPEFTVGHSSANAAVPSHVLKLIEQSDDALLARWKDSWREGWSDERETIFTELTFRGVRVIDWAKQ